MVRKTGGSVRNRSDAEVAEGHEMILMDPPHAGQRSGSTSKRRAGS